MRPGPLRRTLLVTLAVLCLRLPVALLLTLLPARGVAWDYAALILREGLLFLVPALALRSWRDETGRGLCPAWLAPAAIAAGVAAQWLLAVVGDAWMRATHSSAGRLPLPVTPAEWAMAASALIVMPAVAEELFFRGCVQRQLARRMHPLAAWALASLLFALMHGSLAGLPAHLGVGLLLGACMLGGGSLPACMLLHGAYNAAALWWSMFPAEPAWPVTALCALGLAGFLLWLLHRRRPMPAAGLDRGERLLLALLLLGAAAGYLPDV